MKKIFAFLGVVLALLSSCGNSTASTRKTYTQQEIVQMYFKGDAPLHSLGEEVGRPISVVANRVRKSKALSSYATTENLFVIVNITLYSTIKEEVSILSDNLSLWSENIVKYTPSTSGAYLKEEAFILIEKMNYGISKTMSVVYEVPNTPQKYCFVFSWDKTLWGIDVGSTEEMETL